MFSRANCVCPAFTDTDMVRSSSRPQSTSVVNPNEAVKILKSMPLMKPDTVVMEMIRVIEDDKLNGVAVGILSSTGVKDKLVARM